jgi:hypothetical protein
VPPPPPPLATPPQQPGYPQQQPGYPPQQPGYPPPQPGYPQQQPGYPQQQPGYPPQQQPGYPPQQQPGYPQQPPVYQQPPTLAEPYEAPPSTERRYERRHLGIPISFLKELGFGVGLRGRLNHFALEANVGLAPYVFFVSGTCEDVTVGAAAHFTGSLLTFFSGQHNKFQSGLRLAAHADELFGPGGSLGWIGELNLGKVVALQLGAGVQIYPEGEERAENELIASCQGSTSDVFGLSRAEVSSTEAELIRDAVSPVFTTYQSYIGGSVVIYAF